MNILFQEPLVERKITFGKFYKGAGNNTFSCGIADMAGYIRERGYNVSYLEPSIEKFDTTKYLKYLSLGNFRVIGIGSTTLQINKTISTFKLIKKNHPNITTVLGGVHGSIMSEETLRSTSCIDYIILGEGEKPFFELLECIKSKQFKKIKNIEGIAFKEGEKIIINKPNFNNFLNSENLPIPAYDIFPMNKYISQATYTKKYPSFSITCSRGCAFNCAFCCASSISGRKVRYKSINKLINEIILLKKVYNAKGLMFHDSTFTLNNQWVEDFCKALIKRKINMPWSCNSRVDTVNEKLLKLMKQSGCWEILFGIESANQKSLDLIRKGTTVEQNTETLKMSMRLGIYTYASYILCLPHETKEDAMNTIMYAKKIATPIAIFYLPTPYPKTELWNICKKQGGLRNGASWSDCNLWDTSKLAYINPLIGEEVMKKILNYSYVSYYSNPIVLIKNLKEILFLKQSPRKFLYALSALIGYVKK